MQALHDVVKAGYVRYIGMSSCYAWQCEHMRCSTRIELINTFSLRYAEYVVYEELRDFLTNIKQITP